jgi:protein phosphatase
VSTEEKAASAAAEAPGPATAITLEVVGRTDVGLIREHNEDNFVVLRVDDGSRDGEALRRHELGQKGTLLVVCDGMGGAAAGEVASQMAVDGVGAVMRSDAQPAPPPDWTDDVSMARARKLREAARQTNAEIFREARSNAERSGMGTTMTAAMLCDGEAVIAQVGDSRAYVMREGVFTQVTRDQSLVNQLIEAGQITLEQAKYFEHSNVILQALGVQEEVEVQLSRVALREGDLFMLCSDGLVGVVSDEDIAAALTPGIELEEGAQKLIELAKLAGGPDNITVVLCRVGGAAPVAGEGDRIEYKLWTIDPPRPVAAETVATDFGADPASWSAPAAAPRLSTMQLVSIAVVSGLVAGALMTGAMLYRTGVACQVDAPNPGWTILVDGRDSGGRVPDVGPARVRMRAGRHVVSIKGPARPARSQTLEVAAGRACSVVFDQQEEASAAVPDGTR